MGYTELTLILWHTFQTPTAAAAQLWNTSLWLAAVQNEAENSPEKTVVFRVCLCVCNDLSVLLCFYFPLSSSSLTANPPGPTGQTSFLALMRIILLFSLYVVTGCCGISDWKREALTFPFCDCLILFWSLVHHRLGNLRSFSLHCFSSLYPLSGLKYGNCLAPDL